MEKLVKNLEFDENTHCVEEIIKDFSLPVVLKAKSECLLSEKISVEQDDVLTIHGKKTVGVLKGKDSKGRAINLVTVCPYQVQLALPEEDRVVFNSLRELCEKEGRPKFVEIKMNAENELDTVKNGDRLKVLLVEKGANGPLNMHFRNEKGKHIRLPVDLNASFTACPVDRNEYFISEIANINKAPLALFVQFIPCEETTVYSSLGVIEILEQSSIELLYITIKDKGKLYCCVNTSSIKLSGQLPVGLVNKTEEYNWVEKAITELVNVEKFDAMVGSVDPLEWGPNFVLPFDKVFPKKKKDKAKKKEEDARLSKLAVDTDENLSDASSESSKKKKKRFTFFKEDHGKVEKKGNGKEEHREKKDKHKMKNAEGNDGDKSETTDRTDGEIHENEKTDCAANEIKTEVFVDENVESTLGVSEQKIHHSKKSSDEDKKKLKAELKKKEKMEKKQKKEQKKNKAKAEKEKPTESNAYLTTQNSADSLSSGPSAPNSPNCDFEDEYEMPMPVKGMNKAASEAVEAHDQDKPKSKTLISRTWKKMKKRRRALSASNMLRSYSDASGTKHGKQKNEDNDVTDGGECPPPLMEPDYGDDLYEQIPGEFMSQDIYEEAIRAYGAYETAVSPEVAKRLSPQGETADSGFDESDQKALENLREASVPPPLPGNHPKMQPEATPRRGSSLKGDIPRSSVDSAGFRKFYESLKASEAELRSWGPDEIEKALRDLQLDRYNDKFVESQVDGSLLIDLDEAVLRDLGLSLFEARKLRKFVFGWRPDSSRAPDHYKDYDKSSKNPSHWNTPTVAAILKNELGMNEFSLFCAENQVNGDLLRDIVVDEELLKSLLAGKDMRLNSVKLKNFVLDGWRPLKKKSLVGGSSPYEEPVSVMPNQNASAASPKEPKSPTLVKAPDNYQTYEEPVSPGLPSLTTLNISSRNNHSEPTTPVGLAEDSNGQRKKSIETMNLVGSAGGVNSLMQKYEKKSHTLGASPRGGYKTKQASPGAPASAHQGISQRSSSDAPFVANMKKRFADNK